MSITSIKQQILRAKEEAEASLANAHTLRNQWLAAAGSNPTGLTQKEIELTCKAFKNRLLTVKWDCEDLEELVSANDNKSSSSSDYAQELNEAKAFIQECRRDLSRFSSQLDEFESSKKLYQKHGIQSATSALPNTNIAQSVASAVVTSIIQNPLQNHQIHYERLADKAKASDDPPNGRVASQGLAADDAAAEIQHFNKSQIETTIFNNVLYEHYECENRADKMANAAQVFGNLTRPQSADVYMDSNNENEMILEMLETEYYNPPSGLLAKSSSALTTRYNQALGKVFEANQNKIWAVVLSFPILLILFLVI